MDNVDNQKEAALLAELKDACRALELSMKQQTDRARRQVFRMFMHSMDSAISKYERLHDE
jgi:hypothetical protein